METAITKTEKLSNTKELVEEPEQKSVTDEFLDLEELLEARHGKGGLTHSVSLQIANEQGDYPYSKKISAKRYEQEKLRLQSELLKVQNWVRESGERVVGLFEGRDAAGKGGNNQALHGTSESARCACGGARKTYRPGKGAMVLSALY